MKKCICWCLSILSFRFCDLYSVLTSRSHVFCADRAPVSLCFFQYQATTNIGLHKWFETMQCLTPITSNTSKLHSKLQRKYYYYYRYSALGPVWAETRAQSVDWYSSGTLHPGQVLRASLPLLSPAFRRSHFRHQVSQRRERS